MIDNTAKLLVINVITVMYNKLFLTPVCILLVHGNELIIGGNKLLSG